jgi:hypothetical protein
MGFFQNLFGNKFPKKEIRKLSHPRDLLEGDIVKVGFVNQSNISNQEFEVSQTNYYIYDNIKYPEYILKSRSGNIVYLMVEEEDGEECLAFSKKLPKSQIHDLIDEEKLNNIFKKGTGLKVSVDSKKLTDLEDWLVSSYTKTDDNVKGYFKKRTEEESEEFRSYLLTDKSDEYAVEIEKYKTNEVEISITAYHDISVIEEMWPKN